jgi:hypothetical protein
MMHCYITSNPINDTDIKVIMTRLSAFEIDTDKVKIYPAPSLPENTCLARTVIQIDSVPLSIVNYVDTFLKSNGFSRIKTFF